MNTLVIYSHPNHKSLNAAMLKHVVEGLKNKNTPYKIIDLYAENFDPVLVFNEEKKRRDMHKDEALDAYRQAILWAQRIVMIYPIFWGRPPAMLLGFIDRVFASSFAYQDEGKQLPVGLLKGKEAVMISTMKGPSLYMRLLLSNAHQVLMRRALFNFVGIKRVKFFEFGGVESSSKEGSRKRVRAFEKVVAYFLRS